MKEYLKMADIPDFPGFETPGDIDYLKSTPESWSEDYRRVFKSEQTAKRNTTRMFVYSKQLLGLLIQSIDQTNELVAEVERLRESNKRMADAIWSKSRNNDRHGNDIEMTQERFVELYCCFPSAEDDE